MLSPALQQLYRYLSVCESCLYSCVFQPCDIHLENHNDVVFCHFFVMEIALPQHVGGHLWEGTSNRQNAVL